MWMQQRSLLLIAAAALILTTVVAEETLSSPSPTSPWGSSRHRQTTEPLLNSEPPLSGKPEASGESEPGNLLEQVTTGVAPVSLAGAVRSLTEEVNGDLPPNSADASSSSLGSFNLDLLPGESQRGLATEAAAAHSNESQESLDHEGDSEEAPASHGL